MPTEPQAEAAAICPVRPLRPAKWPRAGQLQEAAKCACPRPPSWPCAEQANRQIRSNRQPRHKLRQRHRCHQQRHAQSCHILAQPFRSLIPQRQNIEPISEQAGDGQKAEQPGRYSGNMFPPSAPQASRQPKQCPIDVSGIFDHEILNARLQDHSDSDPHQGERRGLHTLFHRVQVQNNCDNSRPGCQVNF